jgi:hypothetical protein
MNRAAPPGKGALLPAPIQKPSEPHYQHFSSGAQACSHVATVIERMPTGYVHFARVKCRSCGRTLKWLAKPATIEHRRLNSYRLAKLAMCDRLTRWEQSFVENVSQRKTLSPRQQRVVDRLVAEYLEGAV